METAIKVSNLRKNFHEKNVLENIAFEVKLGEMVAITGKISGIQIKWRRATESSNGKNYFTRQ